MNNQDDAGSFERVALPAKRGSGGAPDSRSETLSPRSVADPLLAEYGKAMDAWATTKPGSVEEHVAWVEVKIAREEWYSRRRRRPRGESV